MTTTHTQTPWELDDSDWPLIINGPPAGADGREFVASVECFSAQCTCAYSEEEALENARFIVQAANSYDELVDACRDVANDIDGYLADEWDGNEEGWEALADRLHAALAKAQS